MVDLAKHETQYHTRNTPMGDLEYLLNLWDAVCEEQDRNDYDWEMTKKNILTDWADPDMALDFWVEYMRASIVYAARDVVRESKISLESSEPRS